MPPTPSKPLSAFVIRDQIQFKNLERQKQAREGGSQVEKPPVPWGGAMLMGGAGGPCPPSDCWWQRLAEVWEKWAGWLSHGTPPGHCVFFMGDSEASFALSWSCLGTDAHRQTSCKGRS